MSAISAAMAQEKIRPWLRDLKAPPGYELWYGWSIEDLVYPCQYMCRVGSWSRAIKDLPDNQYHEGYKWGIYAAGLPIARPIKPKTYRLLNEGEIIEAGDEFYSAHEAWVSHPGGMQVIKGSRPVRRECVDKDACPASKQ